MLMALLAPSLLEVLWDWLACRAGWGQDSSLRSTPAIQCLASPWASLIVGVESWRKITPQHSDWKRCLPGEGRPAYIL